MVYAAKSQNKIKAMVGAWPPSQIKLLKLHRQNAQQANREKQEVMQTTYFFDKWPNALLGFNAPITEGLVAFMTPTLDKQSFHIQRSELTSTMDYKHTKTQQLPNAPTHQLKISSTHQLTNLQTYKLTKTSTHKLKKLKNSQAQKNINPKTQKLKS